VDKVELAFRKFDTNKDGFLSRDEFDLVRLDGTEVHGEMCKYH